MAGGWRAPLAQTAVNDATQLVAAMITDGAINGTDEETVLNTLDVIADHIFDRLDAVKAKDDEAYEADKDSKPEKSNRSNKTGGGSNKRSSGGSSKLTMGDALGMELNFGAFKGVSLQELVALTAAECDEDYGYGDGEKDGKDYLRWLAGPGTKSDFVRNRARLIADDLGIEYKTD